MSKCCAPENIACAPRHGNDDVVAILSILYIDVQKVCMGIYPPLIPAALMTFAHFTISRSINAVYCSGVLPTGSAP